MVSQYITCTYTNKNPNMLIISQQTGNTYFDFVGNCPFACQNFSKCLIGLWIIGETDEVTTFKAIFATRDGF